MKHARGDYNRIQDPAGLIPEDEPVFLLRGQDMMAFAAVRYYAKLVGLFGGDVEVSAKAQQWADVMLAWPKKKMPDIPCPAEPALTAADAEHAATGQ